LTDTNRRAIVEKLASGKATVNTLAQPLKMSLSGDWAERPRIARSLSRGRSIPARVLFGVWTKPEHVRKWYGVRQITATVSDIDLRVGGA